MKRFVALLFVLLILANPAFAALSAQTVWNVSTLGSSTNGGGWVAGSTGTNYTLQASPQYAVTDAVANGTTTITSATANFGASDMPGNTCYIVGGSGSIAATKRQIVSRTNSTTIVVDALVAASNNMTLNCGGALDGPATVIASQVASNKTYFKNDGAYLLSTGQTLSLSASLGGSSMPNQWYGYTTIQGDGGKAIFRANASGVTMFAVSGNNWRFNQLDLDCNSQTTCTAMNSTNGLTILTNVKVENFTGSGLTGAYQLYFSEVTGGVSGCSAGANGSNLTAPYIALFNNIHDNACSGINGESFQMSLAAFNLLYNNTGSTSDGIQYGAGTLVALFNVIYNTGRDGIRQTSSNIFVPFELGNIIVNSGGYGNNSNSSVMPAFQQYDGNAYFNNVLGNRHNLDDTGTTNALNAIGTYTNTHDKFPSSDPFVSSAAGNFNLNSTTGSGTILRGTAVPNSWLGNALSAGTPSFGAVQPTAISVVGGSCSTLQ